MILSHRYRFIFLKTAKTAGTSIEIALSEFLGPDDIITPVSRADESLRRQLGFRGPQNYLLNWSQHSPFERLRAVVRGRRRQYYNHMSAAEVQTAVGDKIWNSYYKFCFERNPFDRVISLYYWCCRQEPRPALHEFLQSHHIELLTRRGIDLYTSGDGEIVVDRVGRYESLLTDLSEICSRIGLPGNLTLPHAKTGHRLDSRPYTDLIDDACRQQIETRFRRELDLFGYSF